MPVFVFQMPVANAGAVRSAYKHGASTRVLSSLGLQFSFVVCSTCNENSLFSLCSMIILEQKIANPGDSFFFLASLVSQANRMDAAARLHSSGN